MVYLFSTIQKPFLMSLTIMVANLFPLDFKAVFFLILISLFLYRGMHQEITFSILRKAPSDVLYLKDASSNNHSFLIKN